MGKLTEAQRERERRKFFGEDTAQDIVDQVSEDFAAELKQIMNPAIVPHDFQLHAPSGIRICQVCGKVEMKRTMSGNCAGRAALEGET